MFLYHIYNWLKHSDVLNFDQIKVKQSLAVKLENPYKKWSCLSITDIKVKICE